jgi:ADP-sugar diphosphatase
MDTKSIWTKKGQEVSVEYGSDILESQKELLLKSSVFGDWFAKASPNFEIKRVKFLTILEVKRNNEPFVLFTSVDVEALGSNGQKLPSRLLLRGDAVVVLVVLKALSGDYVLTVQQDRLGCAEPSLIEAVAGMLDNEDPLMVALKEVKEETGLTVTSKELIPLNLKVDGDNHWLESVGLTDESLHYFCVERNVSDAELKIWDNKVTGCAEENEFIVTRVMKIDEALRDLRDSKTVFSILLYQKMKSENRI